MAQPPQTPPPSVLASERGAVSMSDTKVACVDETKALAKCLNATECIRAGYSSRECLTDGRASECDVRSGTTLMFRLLPYT